MSGEDIEQKISRFHFRLELARVVIAAFALVLQSVIFLKLFHFI